MWFSSSRRNKLIPTWLPWFVGIGVSIVASILALVQLWRKLNVPRSMPLPPPFDAPSRVQTSKYGHVTYQVIGKEGPPVLVLHGLHAGASSFEMRRVVETLKETHTVYSVDLLGFGRSDRPDLQYSGGLYVDLIRSFIEEVIARPVILIGRSLSAVYGASVAIRRPDLVHTLVLINPAQVDGVYTPTNVIDRILAPLTRLPVLGKAYFEWSVSLPRIKKHLGRNLFSKSEAMVDEFLKAAYATSHQTGASHAPAHLATGRLALPGGLSDFSRINQPTLVIWGPRTPSNNPPEAAWLSDHPSVEVAIMHDCGALPHEEDPAGFATILHEFLAKQQTISRSDDTNSA